jgi:hypothetical protein
LLGREPFTSLTEAKMLIEQYRVEYNLERPHSALGYRTPAEFAASCVLGTVLAEPQAKNVASTAGAATAFDLSQAKGREINLVLS